MTEKGRTPIKYNYFIGIDVSKDKLDYAVMQGTSLVLQKKGENTPEDIKLFLSELRTLRSFKIRRALFCMEATGVYCNHLLNCLKKCKANTVLENPFHLKNSLGLIRGKEDALDAVRIANYAQKNKDCIRLWEARRPPLEQLAQLSALRTRLVTMSRMLLTPIKNDANFLEKKERKKTEELCKTSVEAVCKDITQIETVIKNLIDSDQQLKRLNQLITSVPGVGPITAAHILVATNEFKSLDCPKKFACYTGVAPFKRESGKMKGSARVSRFADIKLKSLLFLCANASIRVDPEMKNYYQRKTQVEKKHRLIVMNAVRYKIILRIFAGVKHDRLFIKDYRPDDITASELVCYKSIEA